MRLIIGLFLTVLVVLSSCTDHALNETTYDTIAEDDFFETERQVMSVVGPAYTNVVTGVIDQNNGLWKLQEVTSDIYVIPTRGRHWWDGGTHLRAHWHDWNLTEGFVNGGWNYVFDGVSTINRIQYQIERLDEPSEVALGMLTELDALRAWFYYWGLDLFGNVPIVTEHDVEPGFSPVNDDREDVFYFVVDALEDAIPQLNSEVSSRTYGRFHRWAAHTLLAKIYLNSMVYTGSDPTDIHQGQAYLNEVLEHTSAVMESGYYSLEDDYFTNFAANNEVSNENIFVGPVDPVYSPWGLYHAIHFLIHGSMVAQFENIDAPWANPGAVPVPEYVDTFSEDDERRNMFREGLQLSLTGDTLRGSERLSGEPLVLVNYISDVEDAYENEGLSTVKYPLEGFLNDNSPADMVFLRYSDVLLMRAEALMRLNNEEPNTEALDLVNLVRNRVGLPDLAMNELTMEELLAERGREFPLENWRRSDLIRFGKWIVPWFEDSETENIEKKHVNDPARRLFHIPQQQINANPNLRQNPGY